MSSRGGLTQDEEFSSMVANLQRVHENILSVQQKSSEALKAMKAYCKATHETAELFKGFYEKNPDRLTTLADRLESLHHNRATAKYEMLEKFFKDNVFARCEAFDVLMNNLNKRLKEKAAAREKFDHYFDKLSKLKGERDAALKKGKPLASKEMEKISRNEKKLEEAKQQYAAINKAVSREFWAQWRQRFSVVDPIFHEVTKTETLFLTAVSNQLNTLLPDLKQRIAVAPMPEPDEPPCLAARAPPGLEEFQEAPVAKVEQKKKKAANSFEDENHFEASDEERPANPQAFIQEAFREETTDVKKSKKNTVSKKKNVVKSKKIVDSDDSQASEDSPEASDGEAEKPKKKVKGKKIKEKSPNAAAAAAMPDFFSALQNNETTNNGEKKKKKKKNAVDTPFDDFPADPFASFTSPVVGDSQAPAFADPFFAAAAPTPANLPKPLSIAFGSSSGPSSSKAKTSPSAFDAFFAPLPALPAPENFQPEEPENDPFAGLPLTAPQQIAAAAPVVSSSSAPRQLPVAQPAAPLAFVAPQNPFTADLGDGADDEEENSTQTKPHFDPFDESPSTSAAPQFLAVQKISAPAFLSVANTQIHQGRASPTNANGPAQAPPPAPVPPVPAPLPVPIPLPVSSLPSSSGVESSAEPDDFPVPSAAPHDPFEDEPASTSNDPFAAFNSW